METLLVINLLLLVLCACTTFTRAEYFSFTRKDDTSPSIILEGNFSITIKAICDNKELGSFTKHSSETDDVKIHGGIGSRSFLYIRFAESISWAFLFNMASPNDVSLDRLIQFIPNALFPDISSIADSFQFDDPGITDIGSPNNSYACAHESVVEYYPRNVDASSVNFTVHVALRNFRAQAFNVKDGNFSPSVHCDADLTTLPPTPTTTLTPPTTTKKATLTPTTTTTTATSTTTPTTTLTPPPTKTITPTTTTKVTTTSTTPPQTSKTTEPPPPPTTTTTATTTTTKTTTTTATSIIDVGSTTSKVTTTYRPRPTRSTVTHSTRPQTTNTVSPTPTHHTSPTSTDDINNYVIRNNKTGHICIVLRGKIEFDINYEASVPDNPSITNLTSHILIPKHFTTKGECTTGSKHESLTIFFFTDWFLKIEFQLHGSPSSLLQQDYNLEDSDSDNSGLAYSMSDLILSYSTDHRHFPHTLEKDGTRHTVHASPQHPPNLPTKAKGQTYYRCHANTRVPMGEHVSLMTSHLQFKAFNHDDDEDEDDDDDDQFKGKPAVCSADLSSHFDWAVVGYILLTFFLIILVIVLIYLVIRWRRHRRRGYRSM